MPQLRETAEMKNKIILFGTDIPSSQHRSTATGCTPESTKGRCQPLATTLQGTT